MATKSLEGSKSSRSVASFIPILSWLPRYDRAWLVAELHLPVREFGQRAGLLEIIGEDHLFPTVEAAVRSMEK
jgi:hypothetical protein